MTQRGRQIATTQIRQAQMPTRLAEQQFSADALRVAEVIGVLRRLRKVSGPCRLTPL
ncbi:MAG: hypothetical protein HRU82_05085 [Nitrospira sp.]|nr:MAG: hypothetical protein HRU82_05085 [Nitrospira sp.]